MRNHVGFKTHCARASIIAGMFAALASPQSALATLVSGFTSTGVSIRDCRTAAAVAANQLAPDTCMGGLPGQAVESRLAVQPGNRLSSLTALDTLGSNQLGTTSVSVEAALVPGLATLKAGAFSGTPYALSRAWGNVVQGYQYAGQTNAVKALQVSVSYTGSNVSSVADMFDVPQAISSLDVGIAVFSSSSTTFDLDPLADPWYDSLLSPDFVLESFWNGAGDGSGRLDATISFTMMPGRTYFVDSWMLAYAKFGESMDATHTMQTAIGVIDGATGTFTRSTADLNLLSAATVPEPSDLALTLLALLAAAVASRRPKGSTASFVLRA